MKTVALFILSLCLLVTFPAHSGPLRDLVKDRWVQKQKNKPAPEAREDIKTPLARGDYTFKILSSGEARYYKLHVPKSYDPKKPTPLMFAIHGGGGNMEIQADDKYYGQITKSESAGYVVAFPNGSSPFQSGKVATWNAGACCGQARDNKIDDVQFFKDMVKTISGQLNIDPKRIYAVGMSNGGMMAYRLACEMSDTFAGIASVAGTDNTIECKPKRPISVLHIHAKDDDHVLFGGGAGKKAFKDLSAVTEFKSVPDTIQKWVSFNACKSGAKKVLEKNGAFCERYSGCKSETAVQFCVTEGGGHSWPGGTKPRVGAGATPSTAISANEVIWDFFN